MPKSVFLELPSAAASCTPERLSVSISMVDASLNRMLPAMAPSTPRPRLTPPSAAPMPPASFWLKLIDGVMP